MNGTGVSATAMMARAAELLYWTPAYVIGAVFLAALLVAIAVGHRIGTWLRARHRTIASSELSTVQTALLALLGLLLAFTYSFVASRWDARKQAVIAEADARDRLPVIILAMLTTVAVLSLGLVGFANGLTARRHSYFTIALAVVITAVMLVIIDLDRPGRGIVRVSQQPLIDVLESMEAGGPPPERPAPSGK